MRRLPRFITEDVLHQLNAHLDDLRLVYRSMTLVLEECGMRIGELCTLGLDCLSRIGELIPTSGAVPVVIKSLVFPPTAQ